MSPSPHVIPPAPGHLAMIGRQLDYWVTVYKRTWKGSAISSFLMPLFYVVALGILLGGFVDSRQAQLEGASSYLAFVAPGLLAAQAMQTAVGEVTYPVMGMIKWSATYYAMTATPLAVVDVVSAQLLFVAFRVAAGSGVFLLVMAFFGVAGSVLAVLAAFLASLLVGLAFAAPVFAFSARTRSDAGFTLIFRLVVMPLFLFSGAFFPVSHLPPALEVAARFTPLWHGVDLTRMLMLDRLEVGMALVHLGYLAVLTAGGWWLAVRSLAKRLAQ